MKLINAFWELRNSGLTTCEIVFEEGDSFEDYLKSNIEKDFKYCVVKIPSDNLNLLHNLEENGYRFIETQFNIRVAPSELAKIDLKWARVIEGTGYQKLTNIDELDIILTNIGDGMFNSDRIYLDEKLGRETSIKRYTNWIKDLYKETDTEIFFLTKNDNKVGFFTIHNNSKNSIQSVIAGIFNQYQGHGLSIALVYYYLKIASEREVKYVFTSFSSNNIGMLNTFTKTVSFKTVCVQYVLRKLID